MVAFAYLPAKLECEERLRTSYDVRRRSQRDS